MPAFAGVLDAGQTAAVAKHVLSLSGKAKGNPVGAQLFGFGLQLDTAHQPRRALHRRKGEIQTGQCGQKKDDNRRKRQAL